MNPYEQNGIDFIKKIDYLVKRKDLKTKDSLFKVLDCIELKKGFHLGLRNAPEMGLGSESYFYTYPVKEKSLKEDNAFSPICKTPTDIFKNLVVEPSAMGAWQAYMLWMSPTILPLYWHGGYIRREYFFDRENFKAITPFHGEPVKVTLDIIPQPTVVMEENKAVVSCPYWNDWEGLILESMPVIFKDDGSISFHREKHKVLYKYFCGVCF